MKIMHEAGGGDCSRRRAGLAEVRAERGGRQQAVDGRGVRGHGEAEEKSVPRPLSSSPWRCCHRTERGYSKGAFDVLRSKQVAQTSELPTHGGSRAMVTVHPPTPLPGGTES